MFYIKQKKSVWIQSSFNWRKKYGKTTWFKSSGLQNFFFSMGKERASSFNENFQQQELFFKQYSVAGLSVIFSSTS